MPKTETVWRKCGVLRNKYHGDSWFAGTASLPAATGLTDHLRYFSSLEERDEFIKCHNRLIKIYGIEQYRVIYRTLMI